MRILMISMFSNHFFRWTLQLEDAGHEVYWIDTFDSNTYVKKIDFVQQTIGWRNRLDYPGRIFLKKYFNGIYNSINWLNQRDLKVIVEKKIREVNPDLVHSFILQSSTYSILEVMKKFPQVKWCYSAWGNDLYFRQQNCEDLQNIKATLPHLDYMFADCIRDYQLAKELGFKGQYLGTFPTGGGYHLRNYDKYIARTEDRKQIIIKGYEGKLGRCNKVLEALVGIKHNLKDYNITVYGANRQVFDFAKKIGLLKWENFILKYKLTHFEVLKLMGDAKISIGNSISDGMPNTLLEGIIMGAFPLQSNPGGATEEILVNGKNGLLIENADDPVEIASLIKKGLNSPKLLKFGVEYNNQIIKPKLEREFIKEQVLEKYRFIAENL